MNNSTSGPPYGPLAADGSIIIVFWQYLPQKAAAYAFVAIFALLTVVHLGLLVTFRAWHFIPFILGGICKSASVGGVNRLKSPRLHTHTP